MATFQITGSSTTLDATFGRDVELIISISNFSSTSLRYTTSSLTFGSVPTADIRFEGPSQILIDGKDIFFSTDVFIVEAIWAGQATQLMYLHYFDGRGRFNEWTFELGGTPLPRNAEGIDIDLWTSQLQSADIIRTGPLREGANIDLAQVSSFEQIDGITLTGTPFGNELIGGFDDDVLSGLGGNDFLVGRDGDDILRGGKQSDVLNGNFGNDTLFGQRDGDKLYGSFGDDKLNGGGGNDELFGGGDNDVLKGGTRKDLLKGGTGDDKIVGNAGEDTLNGGTGNDKLIAGGDDDELNAGDGNDELRAGAGDDEIRGGAGDDLISGGPGADLFVFKEGHGNDTVTDFDQTAGDLMDLRNLDFADFAALQAASDQRGDDLLITTGTESSILLENILLTALIEDSFQI